MYQLILKDKNFEIEKVFSFLNENKLSFKNFKENFGEIHSSQNLEELYNLRAKLKADGIETIILKKQKHYLPLLEEPKSIELKGEKLFFKTNFEFSINLKKIEILALGIIQKELLHYNPFFYKEKESPFVETKEIDFYLEILLNIKPYRLKLKSDNLTYLKPFKVDLSSFNNFKHLLKVLKSFAPQATTNKTLDLFLLNKNIEYFIYEDYSHFEKELIWLKQIRGL